MNAIGVHPSCYFAFWNAHVFRTPQHSLVRQILVFFSNMPLGFICIERNGNFQSIFSVHQAKNHPVLRTYRLHVPHKCKFIFYNPTVFRNGMWLHIAPAIYTIGFDHVHNGLVITSLPFVVLSRLIHPIIQVIGYRIHFISSDIQKETHIRFPVVKIL